MKATKTTIPLRDRCLSHCATLRIPLEGASLDEVLSRAEKENLSHLHFLDLLLGTQADARRAVEAVRRIVGGECFVVAVGIIERLGDGETGRCTLLDRQIGPRGESGDAGHFRIVRRQQPAVGKIAIGVGQILIDRERAAKG